MDGAPGHDKGLLPLVSFGFEWQLPSGRSPKRKGPSDMPQGLSYRAIPHIRS